MSNLQSQIKKTIHSGSHCRIRRKYKFPSSDMRFFLCIANIKQKCSKNVFVLEVLKHKFRHFFSKMAANDYFVFSSDLIFIHNHAIPYTNMLANFQNNLTMLSESRAKANLLNLHAVGHFEFATSAKLHTYGMYSDLATCSLDMKTIGPIT